MTSWYETFFSGLSVEFWIQAAPQPSPEELNFLREQFAIQPGQSVLDVACGAGRHSVPLAKLGFAVTGVEYLPSSSPLPGVSQRNAASM